MSPCIIQYWIVSKDPEFDIIYTTRTDDIYNKIKSNFHNFDIVTEKEINDHFCNTKINLKNKYFLSF